jgi:hypothetical protein
MFPETTMEYTDPSSNVAHTLSCYIPGIEPKVASIVCPDPFVRPIDGNHPANCIQPCPVSAYTNQQYTGMWMVSSVVATCGLCLNLFMILTWSLGTKRDFAAIRFQIRSCVIGGVLYGLVRSFYLTQTYFSHGASSRSDRHQSIGQSAHKRRLILCPSFFCGKIFLVAAQRKNGFFFTFLFYSKCMLFV